jgi:hypothetical protein
VKERASSSRVGDGERGAVHSQRFGFRVSGVCK